LINYGGYQGMMPRHLTVDHPNHTMTRKRLANVFLDPSAVLCGIKALKTFALAEKKDDW